MNIFSEVKEAAAKTKEQLKSLSSGTPAYEIECDKAEALNTVVGYIKQGNYTSNAKSHERVMHALRCKSYAQAAQELATTEESLRASVYQASERIRAVVGFDIVTEIMQGDPAAAMCKFAIRTEGDTISALFPTDVLANLPKEPSLHKIDSQAILSAAKALHAVTIRALVGAVYEIPEDALHALAYILFSNDQKYLRQTAALYRYLRDDPDMGIDALSAELNIETKGV